jgi:hypothetical protein
VGMHGAHADVQLGGDLGVGAAPGDQGDQLPLAGAEPPRPRRRAGTGPARGGEQQGVLGRGGQLEPSPDIGGIGGLLLEVDRDPMADSPSRLGRPHRGWT